MNGKHSILVAAASILVASMALSCGGKHSEKAEQDTTAATTAVADTIHDCNQLECWRYRDTIVGNWDGKGLDTIVAEPIDTPGVITDPEFDSFHYNWRLRSLSGRIAPADIPQTVGVRFVGEGDLDGDGCDDLSYRTEWTIGNWQNVYVLTLKNGKWMWLIENQPSYRDHFYDDLKMGTKMIEKASKPGWLKVRLTETDQFEIVDTLIRIDVREMKWEDIYPQLRK